MANISGPDDDPGMGYSREHTQESRERILESAARAFRRDGYDTARIDDIMAGAGLTRGGFYAHFRSKADLFQAYVGRELAFGVQLRRAEREEPTGASAAFDFYLSPGNRGKVARGCTIVSNAADVARGPLKTRRAFTNAFQAMREAFAEIAHNAEDPDAAGLAAIATCVGGVVLARALADETVVEELLEACRDAVADGIQES